MDIQKKTMYQVLRCLKSLSADSPRRITWPCFFERYSQEYGEVDEKNLAYHVKHAAQLGLAIENLHLTPVTGLFELGPAVQGHIVGLTPEGNHYAKNKYWKYVLWGSRKAATFIGIILATFIGGLLARYYEEIGSWFS